MSAAALTLAERVAATLASQRAFLGGREACNCCGALMPAEAFDAQHGLCADCLEPEAP